MLIYAGIDEAGYGPLFGPLVVARAVFAVQDAAAGAELPCLWRRLQGVVCRQVTDKKQRIAVNDSKALYTPAAGLAHLERGVVSFLRTLGITADRLQDLLETLGIDDESRGARRPWYADGEGGPTVPVAADPIALRRAQERLARAGDRTGVRLCDAAAAVVFEDRFNDLVALDGSKAACAWRFVAAHLRAVWERYGEQDPKVVVDRQSGRRYYGDLLALEFSGATVAALEEGPVLSRYRVAQGRRSMEVTVQVESERFHLPAAQASMTAKYVRELLMLRFRAYWLRHAPDVRPTYGYFGDGTRFLREIEPLLLQMDIDRRAIVRSC